MPINNEILSLILFTDEASFTNYGLANLHNMQVTGRMRIRTG